MSASTADRSLTTQTVATIPYGVADNKIIYKDTCVCTDSSGWLNLAADTSGFVYAGLSAAHADNTIVGHTAGGITCDVTPPANSPESRYIVQDFTSPAQTAVGALAYFTDDHTVAVSSSNSVKMGIIVQIIATGTSGKVLVDTMRIAA